MNGHQPAQDAVTAPSNQNSEPDKSSQPVRSRWTPKPEQIMILESIFNSGTVNPPKEETVRIRKLLEKFGPIVDANVFYWFQNHRSRSRRKQRQIQASLEAQPPYGGTIQYSNTMAGGFGTDSLFYPMNAGSSCATGGSGSSSSRGTGGGNVGFSDELFEFPGETGHQPGCPNPVFVPSDASSFYYRPGLITVFINGVATEVGSGPLDMKAMFGEDFVLVHSSGVPVQVNEYGFLVQGLQHGEAYFLVPRHS